MPAGQTPHTVILFAHNDLVDAVQPGDRFVVLDFHFRPELSFVLTCTVEITTVAWKESWRLYQSPACMLSV